jgi:hypothetical protein
VWEIIRDLQREWQENLDYVDVVHVIGGEISHGKKEASILSLYYSQKRFDVGFEEAIERVKIEYDFCWKVKNSNSKTHFLGYKAKEIT